MEGEPLHFHLRTGMGNADEILLQPFFEIHDCRYMMYFEVREK